ncbi:MAG: glycosyltransferase family A protein [Actinomycetota bacterium]|nr:glycosyltransferase family A protein [Actinomycetota bacterium]
MANSSDARAPSISAIITCYNNQATIAEAIESALAQSHLPEEVIVVDDGSTDGSLAAIAPFKDRVTLIAGRNGGPSAARNRGLEAAGGKWVAFLDGDDAWHTHKLAVQLVALEANPDAIIIASDWSRDAAKLAVDTDPGIQRLYASHIAVLNRFQTSSVLALRSAIEHAGGFDPRMDTAEDWDMWLRVAKLGPAVLVKSPMVFYRDNPNGVSKDVRTLSARAQDIVARERKELYFEKGFVDTIGAWHLQRFMVAAALGRDWSLLARLASGLPRAGRPTSHLRAFVSYTLPFLAERLKRRAAA